MPDQALSVWNPHSWFYRLGKELPKWPSSYLDGQEIKQHLTLGGTRRIFYHSHFFHISSYPDRVGIAVCRKKRAVESTGKSPMITFTPPGRRFSHTISFKCSVCITCHLEDTDLGWSALAQVLCQPMKTREIRRSPGHPPFLPGTPPPVTPWFDVLSNIHKSRLKYFGF